MSGSAQPTSGGTMSPEAFDALLSEPAPSGQPAAAPGASMDAAAFDALLSDTPTARPGAAPTGAATTGTTDPAAFDALLSEAPAAPVMTPQGGQPAPQTAAPVTVNGNEIDAAGQIGGAILTGAAKSIYETKDFIFGKPEDGEKSDIRRRIETLDRDLGNASIANSFVSGLSQFATGMLGAGKLVSAAKAVPGVGGAVGALEASRKGAMALSSGKAAAVGAVAFDPNGPRLSDLVVLHGPAWLQNPVSSYLSRSGNEDDSAALGRIKNALESIGTDAALAGVFALSVRGYAKMRDFRSGTGTAEEVEAATAELAQAVAHKDAKLAASKGDLETLEALRQEHPQAVADAELAVGRSLVPETPPAIVVKPDGTAEVNLPEIRTDVPALPAARDTAGEVVSGPADTGEGANLLKHKVADISAAMQPNLLGITHEQVSRLIEHSRADTEQLLAPGGWDAALERGYKFGDGGRIPWQKFALEHGTTPGTSPLDQVIRRVSDEFAGEIAAAKGGDLPGGVRSDAFQDRLIAQRVAIYGDDPEALMGALQLAGRNADRLVADVAAADLITLRASQDAQNLAARIQLGMLEEFGGDLSTAMAALKGHFRVAATARAESASMVANAARTLRRQRADFSYSLEDVARLEAMSDAKLLTIIESAGRDPRVADRLLRRGFWEKVGDDASYLYVNNLLWGLRTHFVNLSTNLYMVGARPLERMIGGAIQGDRRRVAENARQYGYMVASLHEAWRDAVRTWQLGDSILAPHSAELNTATVGRSVNWAAEQFKPATSVSNILSNAYVGFMKAAGLPTRALGAVDELVKQTVYRSKVMAAAHGDGIEQGLEGAALSEHVRRTLDAAFDDAGRAVDLRALEEANIATFQQDLLPNTFGAKVQGFVGDSAVLRIILPFIRTPANVFRMGVKLTPGLNYVVQREYRSMLRGEMGPEKQAQAMGQMAMGSLFMGLAGYLAHSGFITGGGPADPKLRQQLMATGWQPYSFVVPGADGSPTYVNFGRFDPIAMPFGIVADVVDILERDHDGDGWTEQAGAALGGAFLSVVKQLGQKTYLTSINDTLTALLSQGANPEDRMMKAAGKTAANFVPFASGLRFANPDPLMRETRGVVDSIMATVPGLSERLPAKRDLFGDPLTVNRGLWVTGKTGFVDAEVRRMIDEAGVGPFGPPHPTQREVDLRDVTTKDGRNAYEVYQELAGHPPKGPSMKETLARIMRTEAYQRAPDRNPEVDNQKGTRQAMLTGTVAKYREGAMKWLMRDENVRQAVYQQRLKGNAALARKAAPKSDQATGAAGIARIGQAFGVQLGGVLSGE